jgi:hypothetical protein
LGQAKFEEPDLLRCRYFNQLGFHDIYIHASTFTLTYYEERQSPAQPCPEKCVKNIRRPNHRCLEMNTLSIAQTLQRHCLPTFIKP